ncbi:MAG: UDP-glucose/GDP-mannose dehydrogenase family protein [Patescibacteria group bacterium]
MTIAVIGTGFVGVVTAAVYASFGHKVFGLDIDQKKINKLKKSQVPFHEPQLEDLLKETQKKNHLSFTTSYQEAIQSADLIIVAVGTPSTIDGGVDLKYVFACAESLAPYLKSEAVVVVKSTVPPGTLDLVRDKIKSRTKTKFNLASLPEFLREGSAVNDTLHPDRIVIGAENQTTFELLGELHAPLKAPIVRVRPESAQMAKYAANAYLAMRITFINQVADICEKSGADIEEVISAIGYDKRIGAHYWYPGPGYGGSCFPKDVKELAHFFKQMGKTDNLFVKINQLNSYRINLLLTDYGRKVGGFKDKQILVLGLSFKPNTDDLREAPSTKFIPQLIKLRAQIIAFDPVVKQKTAQAVFGQYLESGSLIIEDELDDLTNSADAIFLLTEWSELISLDYSRFRNGTKPQWLFDIRNRLNPVQVRKWGFKYQGIGRQG